MQYVGELEMQFYKPISHVFLSQHFSFPAHAPSRRADKRRTSNASLCQESGLLEGLSDNLAVLALARARRSSMSGNMLAPQTPLHVNRIGGDNRSSKVAPMLESILDAHDKEPVGHDHDARGGKVSFASNGASATAARPSKLGVIGDLTVQSVSMLHLHDGDAMGATESSAPNQSLDLAGTLSSPSAQCAGSVPGNSVSARNSTRSTEALHGQVAAGRPDLSTDSILESTSAFMTVSVMIIILCQGEDILAMFRLYIQCLR